MKKTTIKKLFKIARENFIALEKAMIEAYELGKKEAIKELEKRK